MRSSRIIWQLSVVVLGLTLTAISAHGETLPEPNTKCTQPGVTKTVNALTYKCKKATKLQYSMYQHKYIWGKGKLKSVPGSLGASFDGRKYGDGAVVGKDVKPGRYWTIGCVGWQQFGDDGLIARWGRNAEQSIVELRAGETLLTGCKWYLGEPPAAKVLPTGKLSMKTQLLPGRYRPINEFCMSGPTDPRSPDAISASSNIITWEQQPTNFALVITGNENWLAYGLTSECGGFTRLD